MFGFFSRKKNFEVTKSKTSESSATVCEPAVRPTSTVNLKVSKNELETKAPYAGLFIKSKKRPAPPPPPPPPPQPTSVNDNKETSLGIKFQNENSTETMKSNKEIEKSDEKLIIKNMKAKKPAPPPPSSRPQSPHLNQSYETPSSLNDSKSESGQVVFGSEALSSTSSPILTSQSQITAQFAAKASSSPIGSSDLHQPGTIDAIDASKIDKNNSFSSEMDELSSNDQNNSQSSKNGTFYFIYL